MRGCQLVIDCVYAAAAMGKSDLAKYKDPDGHQEEALHNQEVKINGLVEDLFGNETPTGDALAYGEGVGFTTSKIKES